MKKSTLSRRQAAKELSSDHGAWLVQRILDKGKCALDELGRELGKALVEAVFLIEREEVCGPNYHPRKRGVYKWASQQGSVYVGKHKEKVMVPRIRSAKHEIPLSSYQRLKNPEVFSEQLTDLCLSGMSARRYDWLVQDATERLGVSASSVSRHVALATAKRLEQFRERPLKGFDPFAIFIDSVHRGESVFVVALGVDMQGQKQALGFWEGATENFEICEMLFCEVEKRGLSLHGGIVFITDGGKGIKKSLHRRFGKKVLHQRCTVHKCRNIRSHLPKRYQEEARRRYNLAIGMESYEDARKELLSLHKWLNSINGSAAESLMEGFDELLLLHRLKVPLALRRSLRSTNAIEGLFSRVRFYEKNIRRYHNSAMSRRWLGTVLLHSEQGFKKIRGHECIKDVKALITSYCRRVDTKSRAA
jgi:putative transposase